MLPPRVILCSHYTLRTVPAFPELFPVVVWTVNSLPELFCSGTEKILIPKLFQNYVFPVGVNAILASLVLLDVSIKY